jgi:hypothetical protein
MLLQCVCVWWMLRFALLLLLMLLCAGACLCG